MRPLLFNASHILNAPNSHVTVINERRVVCRLYDSNPGGIINRLMTRIRIAWAVFRGEYDALCWDSPSPTALAEAADLYRKYPGSGWGIVNTEPLKE